jgi:cell division protein FtsQ
MAKSVKKREKKRKKGYSKVPFFLLGILSILSLSFVPVFQKTLVSLWWGLRDFSTIPLQEVRLFGRYRASQDDILGILCIKQGQSLFSTNLESMKQRLLTLDWIKNATLKRSLCGVLYIHISEREPVALYYHSEKKKFFLVDKDGFLIRQPIAACFRGLPVLSGENAAKEAYPILQLLKDFPSIRSKLTAMAFIQNRRWNLRLNHQIEVKLPEVNIEKSLKIIQALIVLDKVFSGDVLSIDLRQPGQITLTLSDIGKNNLALFKNAKNL